MQGLLAETTTVIIMPYMVLMALILTAILAENSAETALLALSSGLNTGLMGMMFFSETLQFAGLFGSCQCLTLTSISASQVVALGTGAMCITLVLSLLGQALGVYSLTKGMSMTLALLMAMGFMILHSLDHATLDVFVNTNSQGSIGVIVTSIHASHVVQVAIMLRLIGSSSAKGGSRANHKGVNNQGALVQLTYCHQVEVLWLAIMSIAMLANSM